MSASSNYRAFYGRRQPRSMPGHGVVRHGLLNTVQENPVLLEGHLENNKYDRTIKDIRGRTGEAKPSKGTDMNIYIYK